MNNCDYKKEDTHTGKIKERGWKLLRTSPTSFKRFFPWKRKSYEGIRPNSRFIFLRNSGCVCVQHFTKQTLLPLNGRQEIISLVYQLCCAGNGVGLAIRSEKIATMWQDKPWIISRRERKQLDSQGTTGSGPCCRRVEYPRKRAKALAKNRVCWRVLMDALCYPNKG